MEAAIMNFPWTGDDVGPKTVYIYALREASLADADAVTDLCVDVQRVAGNSTTLSMFEHGVRMLAGERGLWVGFYGQADHSDPLGQRVSIGFRPAAKAPNEPLVAYGEHPFSPR